MLNSLKNAAFLVILLVASVHVLAEDYFSHAVIDLPYDYESSLPWFQVINSQEELVTFIEKSSYGQIGEGDDPLPVPEVDFDAYTLVVGGLGFQPTGGYSIAVDHVVETTDDLRIYALGVVPGESCLVDTSITYPTIGVLLRKTDKNIVAVRNDVTFHCD